MVTDSSHDSLLASFISIKIEVYFHVCIEPLALMNIVKIDNLQY